MNRLNNELKGLQKIDLSSSWTQVSLCRDLPSFFMYLDNKTAVC